uniref:40S ribosomal protein S26 n=1 Tax=Oryza punctata TaxID=4537 RepID=A0A0E0KKN9_ORYPU
MTLKRRNGGRNKHGRGQVTFFLNPKLYAKVHHCVSCAIHAHIVRVGFVRTGGVVSFRSVSGTGYTIAGALYF